MASHRRVCIIGAGISGLAAAKVFKSRGHSVTLLEGGAQIGGVWDPARSYPDVKTQTPRDLYAFSDQPMPKTYPEWPSGLQVFDYLSSYADANGLRPAIEFGQTVTALHRRADGLSGWEVTTEGADGAAATRPFDFVVVCTGQFSQPNKPTHPGDDAFRAAGGTILHSSEYHDPALLEDKRVVVLGFSKSATDIAVNAVTSGAKAITIVYREPTWKVPYFFGGLINFKNILFCRAAESMFLPFDASPARRIAQNLATPLIWANWRALESLLKMQFKLKKSGLVPTTRIEDTIHCTLAIETPGFYKMVADGAIETARGTIERYEGGTVVLTGGAKRGADVVVLATGWTQDKPYLDAETQAKIIEPDGQYRLYRMIVNPDVPDLGFVGLNSSFTTTLSAELGANWLVRFMDGKLARQPSIADMNREIERSLTWRRKERPAALNYGGLCIAPYHNAHFDTLLTDMGTKTRGPNPLAATFAPINPSIYATFLAKAPDYELETTAAAPKT